MIASLAVLVAVAVTVLLAAAVFGRALARQRRRLENAVVACLADGPRFSHALAQDLEEELGMRPPAAIVDGAADRLRLAGLLVWGEPGFVGPAGAEDGIPVRRLYRLTSAGDRRARRLLDRPPPARPGPLGRREGTGSARPTGWGS
ncbi:MAG: PadR family transcriptional regulator [Actinomycetota bacterium]|nr:PadR family transcriptional regulator [Actinomycetota bacterium]